MVQLEITQMILGSIVLPSELIYYFAAKINSFLFKHLIVAGLLVDRREMTS